MSTNLLIAEPPKPGMPNQSSAAISSSGGVVALEMPGSMSGENLESGTGQVVGQASYDQVADEQTVSVAKDLVQLTKPRIVVMILVTTIATAVIAAGGGISAGTMLLLLIGTGLVAGSAGGANQIWERVIDRRMARTSTRPLPARRLSLELATAYTASIGTLGTALLWMRFGSVPALVGIATWMMYVLVYTPMKTRTSLNTTVGAIAGALPMLIGYTALGGSLSSWTAWLLFGVLAAWQYPHFMAIAWLYRRQYAEAGFRMSTTVEPTGVSAAIQSIVGSVAVIGCGIALCCLSPGWVAATISSVAVLVSTLPMLRASIRFAVRRDDQTARKLLRSSLLVLPAVLAAVTFRVFW